uniref:Uncharacterized protein n=1 Tax=viral metagenome TaxID=1070528 RepID=A0A6C0KUT9_9ZZZZ
MESKQSNQFILFRKDDEEITDDIEPVKAISRITSNQKNYCIIHKVILNGNIDIYITYKKNKEGQYEFLRGFMYKNNCEFQITSCPIYSSLQIGSFGYDNIMICYYNSTPL